jgi:lambda family phage minor tail protein L
MYTLNSVSKIEKNKKENEPIYLYTIHDYNSLGNNLTYAEANVDIVYDTVTYSKFPIKHDEISENSRGEIDSFRVSVTNVNRVLGAYLETYDLRGKKVTITLVWANQLADADAHIDFIYYIDNYSVTEDVVEFVLTSKFDVLEIALPLGKYCRNYCRWKFKSTECGYPAGGAQTTCDKRKATCKATMLNLARFGGFPSIPTDKLYT